MRYDLAEITRRQRKPRRSAIPFKEIRPPAMRATTLYRQGYLPVVNLWGSASAAILAEYSRTLTSLQMDAPADVERIIGEVEVIGATVLMELRIRVARWAEGMEAWHRRRWRGRVLASTGVDVSTLIGPADARVTIEAAIRRNVGLVRSISDQTRDRLTDIVFRGLTNRTPTQQVASEIRQAIGMGRRRARNVAADQNVKITAALNSERRREAGIDHWEWIHSGKVHARDVHKARNGKRYTDKTAPEDTPGQLPYCGCTERAVLIL